jgi:hypothetical protein
MSTEPLAQPSDVAALWHPLSLTETDQVTALITKASARLRQQCPFDIDERIALFGTDPTNPIALNPDLVADLVATKVKNFLVNPDGVATSTDTAGPFSRSATFVNRYDKTGSDIRGSLQFTDADIEQIRPAVPFTAPSSFQVGVPDPQVVLPGYLTGRRGGLPGVSVVVPDVFPDRGSE